MDIQYEKARKSVTTLANATELAAQVIINIAGNDISNTIGGSPLGMNTIRAMAQARFQDKLKLNGK